MPKKNGPPRPPTTHELQKRIEDLEENVAALSQPSWIQTSDLTSKLEGEVAEIRKCIEELRTAKKEKGGIGIQIKFVGGLIEFFTMVKGRYICGRQEEATVAFSQFCRRLNEEAKKYEG